MRNHESGRQLQKDLLWSITHPPINDRRFWLAQSLLAAALLIHLGAGIARDLGRSPVPGFVLILFLFIPIVYAGSIFGLAGSVAVALEGIIFSITQELLLPHSASQLWGAWSILAAVLVIPVLLGVCFDKKRERHAVGPAAKLLQSEQCFHLAFANNIAGMAVTDLETRMLAVNSSLCKMLGRESEELLGQDFAPFTVPEDRHISKKLSERALKGGQSQGTYTKRYQHKDGHIVWAEVSAALAYDELGNPEYFVTSIRDITEERLLLAQLSFQAQHDPLTGLANRAMFEDHLTKAIARSARGKKTLAVFLIDLDEFKDINDTFGHQIGDDLLREVARRLEQLTRSSDILCRFGGDEFLYLSEGLTNPHETEAIAKRLLSAFDEPFTVGEESLDQAASIGIATCVGENDSVNLLRNADTALSEAKHEGKNRYALFQPEMYDQVSSRIGLVQELRRSFGTDEVLMHYQPIVDLNTSQTVGVEALMRWNHPELGWVPPYVFIPLAEQSKLIFDLGSFALGQAVREAASWRHLDQREAQPYIAVNLSPRQFRDPELLNKIKEVLETNQFEPSRLVLEITEGAAFADIDAAARVASRLRQLGVSLAIDDFGTGYSSLSYFTVLRPSILKIDQSFVGRAHDSVDGERLLGAVITIGHSLGAKVVAEGIETTSQLEMLRSLGYHFGQGYLFSPAVPSADLSDMIENVSISSGVSPPPPPRHVATIPITYRSRSSAARKTRRSL